jgi:hypothetical protein
MSRPGFAGVQCLMAKTKTSLERISKMNPTDTRSNRCALVHNLLLTIVLVNAVMAITLIAYFGLPLDGFLQTHSALSVQLRLRRWISLARGFDTR